MNHCLSCFLGGCIVFTVGHLNCAAAPITVPPGLNPGAQYRLAFVTSTTTDSQSSEIADYNAFVTTVANSVGELASLATTWTAIASTDSVDARDNTSTNPNASNGVPVYDLAGILLATSNSDLWDGSIGVPLAITETGTTTTATFAWTGTKLDGVATLPLGAGFPSSIGNLTKIDSGWIFGAASLPTTHWPVYALSSVVTVAPEPSSMVLALLAACALAPSRLRVGHHIISSARRSATIVASVGPALLVIVLLAERRATAAIVTYAFNGTHFDDEFIPPQANLVLAGHDCGDLYSGTFTL